MLPPPALPSALTLVSEGWSHRPVPEPLPGPGWSPTCEAGLGGAVVSACMRAGSGAFHSGAFHSEASPAHPLACSGEELGGHRPVGDGRSRRFEPLRSDGGALVRHLDDRFN